MGAGCCGGTNDSPVHPSKNPQSRMEREQSAKLWFTHINVATDNPLKLIQGYEKEPLVSLEEALQPFQGKIEQLSQHIQEAKVKCCHSSKHQLTNDESAAIYIYSMKWGTKCLYDHLQIAWKSNKRSELKPWFKYLKLFKAGLDKLPIVEEEIWQGTTYDEQLKKKLTSDEPLYISMSSCVLSEDALKGYIRKDKAGRLIFAGYKYVDGRDVTGYTANGWKEVIVMPGPKIGKAALNETADGALFIHFTGRQYKTFAESAKTKVSSNGKHFVCPRKGCGNRCPGGHDRDHCHTFAILTHTCEHHCKPPGEHQYKYLYDYNECEKCHKKSHKLCKCYNCGGSYCEECCYK